MAFFPALRSRTRFAIAALLAMAVATVPIWPRLASVAYWLWSLLTRSGVYGKGPVGVPGGHQLRDNLERILMDEPFMPAWLVFHLAALVALRFGLRGARDESSRATSRALAFGVFVTLVQVALATKHYIGPRYLLPALVATALPNAALFHFLSLRRLRDGMRRALAIGGGVLFAASLVTSAVGLAETFESGRSHRAEVLELAQARQRLGDCVTIGYYRSSAGNYALHIGNRHSNRVHAAALERRHPGSLQYQRLGANLFNGFARGSRNDAVAKMVRRGRCVLVQGSVLEGGLPLPPGFALRELVRGRYETLGRLELAEPR